MKGFLDTADVFTEVKNVVRNFIISAGAVGTTTTTQWLAFGRLQGTGARVGDAAMHALRPAPPAGYICRGYFYGFLYWVGMG